MENNGELVILRVGWLWQLGTLVPVIGLVQVGAQAMADRYTYLPLIGVSAMIAWGVDELRRRVAPGGGRALAALAVVVLALWGALAARQCAHWHDSVALFSHAARISPGSAIVHTNLGAALAERGRYDEALEHFREAYRLDPNDPKARMNLIRATGGAP